MRLVVISVGRDRSGLFQPAVDEYAKRIRRHFPVDLIELPPSKARQPERARREEGERILAAVPQGAALVALDERGRSWPSEKLAGWLSDRMLEGRDLAFVVGGDEGLDPEVRRRAAPVLAFGPQTLPHRLARVVLVEQLYRAVTIVRGEPYHK